MTVRSLRDGVADIVPWPEDLAERYIAAGHWTGRPMADLIRAAAEARPDATALVDGGLRLSHRELWERADGAAVRLSGLGLRAGDRIVVQLPTRWEFVVLTLACLRLGVLPVMALPAHRRHELTYLAEHSDARAIAVPDVLKGFDHQELAAGLGLDHVLVSGDDVHPGNVDLRALCRPADDPDSARRELDRNPPDARGTAVFLLSGGTTGLPKLIPRTHDDYACGMRYAAEACRFDQGTVYLAVLPVSHNFTLAGPGVLGTLYVGGKVVLTSSPDPARVFPLIERERVTIVAVVPAVAQRWLDYQEAGHPSDIGSLGILQVGGARLADHVARRVAPTLGCVLQQGYGMAEGLICLTRVEDPDEVACNTQGRPICADDELLIVDEDGKPVPPGEPGVLLTRGPYTLRGYYRAEEHNARSFVGAGWYRTGDIVRLRPDGNLVIEGREKDMINRGGEKISAEEVENLAYQVEGVRQAAAVAMPDPELGERVCLYVVPRPGANVTLDAVVAVMERAETAAYKRPERLILIDSLPATNIGKIDKKALRADVQRRISVEDQQSAARG